MYERILQRTGQEWEVYHNIAMINESLRRYDKAAEAMEQMLKINPGAGQLRQSLADMYLRANQVDKAMTIISDLLERDSSNAELRSMLAGIFLQRDQWDKAREQFEIVLKDDSLSADTRFKIGFAFFLQIQKDSTLLPITRKQFEKFQKQYPGDWRPLFYLGMMSMLTKHDTAAINYFERVTALAAWNADAWAYLGSLYFDRGNYQQLIATMDRARQNVPNDARVYLLLGLAYTRLSRNDDAIAALERSIEIDPKDLNALSALGLAYDNVKRYKDCDRIYDSALTIDAHNALVLNNYAYSLSERGEQLERAMTMSRESLQKDSLNSSFLDTYGWILYKLERFDEALIYIQRSISAGEANAVVFEHLGDVYDKLKMPEKAREYWKKGLEMDSSNLSLKAKLEREIP
jgi:tetratricopeptide (TPR) repeat protein